MTEKADFNAEEWDTIAQGPLLAGARVITASKGGTIRESLAMGKAYAKAKQELTGDSSLIDALVAAPPSVDREKMQGDLVAIASEGLAEAARLFREKATPEELDAYRSFVLSVAEAVANANKEGDVLGIGGKRVSEGEQAAIDEIAAALQADPA